MKTKTAGSKGLSLILMIAGAVMTVAALALDFMGNKASFRGPLLVIGVIAFFLGLYLFPTLAHHRKIVYVIFLLPLLFTFAVTVIIPLVLGIFYSMTDWTGIKFTHFVGLANYAAMFKDPAFIWSVLMTFLFVVINMVLVNLVAFLLALLCTSGLKGDGFFRAAYFLPNLIGGIVLGYIWQFVFNNVLINVTKISWLVQTKTAMLAIVIVYVWQYAGYIMLIYITGLTQVPKDVLEAASIDGADAKQTLFQHDHDLHIPDPDIRVQAVRRQPGVDGRHRFCPELHGRLPDKRYADAGIEHLQYCGIQEQLFSWSGQGRAVLHHPGMRIPDPGAYL